MLIRMCEKSFASRRLDSTSPKAVEQEPHRNRAVRETKLKYWNAKLGNLNVIAINRLNDIWSISDHLSDVIDFFPDLLIFSAFEMHIDKKKTCQSSRKVSPENIFPFAICDFPLAFCYFAFFCFDNFFFGREKNIFRHLFRLCYSRFSTLHMEIFANNKNYHSRRPIVIHNGAALASRYKYFVHELLKLKNLKIRRLLLSFWRFLVLKSRARSSAARLAQLNSRFANIASSATQLT